MEHMSKVVLGFYYVSTESKPFLSTNSRDIPRHFFQNSFTVQLVLYFSRRVIKNLTNSLEVRSKAVIEAERLLTAKGVWRDCDSVYLVTCLIKHLEPNVDSDSSMDFSSPDFDEEIMIEASDEENTVSSFDELSSASSGSDYDSQDTGYRSDESYHSSETEDEIYAFNDSLLS